MPGKRKPVPKTRCHGTMTESQFNGWIVSLLRRGFLRWTPRSEALKRASVGKKINKKTGRLAEHKRCCKCGVENPTKEMKVDHIVPVTGPEGHTTWDDRIERMYTEVDNFQVMCEECHNVKTKEERGAAAAYRKAKKEAEK